MLLVALATGLSVYLRGGEAGFFSNLTGSVRIPAQKAASSVVDWLEGAYGYLYKYDQLEVENESLRAQLAAAQQEARDAAEALEENERLRELLNLQEKRSDFVFESAKIVSWDASNWGSYFSIGKGSNDGIELYDSVVTEYGALVGQIAELGTNWATVRTLVDVDFEVGALVGEGGYAGMVVGEFSYMQAGQTRITYLPAGAQLFEGDVVLTSGKGGAYPQGLVIGTVEKLRSEGGGQNAFGVIEPACRLGSLAQVFIIKDFKIVE